MGHLPVCFQKMLIPGGVMEQLELTDTIVYYLKELLSDFMHLHGILKN